ncbi:hypothetical protein [Streptomyces sp. NPDC004546]|uniref:hypothetical protein n=1 Tax=Streptomyces sp. NPDC004546 TaxID=3154282 RepID=UPI0033B5E006
MDLTQEVRFLQPGGLECKVTHGGVDELDSFIAFALINRCRKDGLEAFIMRPTPVVTLMNGVEVVRAAPDGTRDGSRCRADR